jgi:hypothetical protein
VVLREILEKGIELFGTIEAQQQEIQQLQKQKENILASHKLLEDEVSLLREFKSTIKENEGNVWYYMSGEDNHIETMVSDLVVRIRADDLRALIHGKTQQLQAQNAELRDNLKWLKSISFSHEDDLVQWPGQETREAIEHALSDKSGTDYHNPADVEALKKANEAILEFLVKHVCDKGLYDASRMIADVIEKTGGENEKE